MGKTDSSAARHKQQSMILLPFKSPGVKGNEKASYSFLVFVL